MDRQALLEQKRQRLLELKQRRLQKEQVTSTTPENEPAPPEEKPKQPSPKRVNKAIQVDLDVISDFLVPAEPTYQPVHLNKIVQTSLDSSETSESDSDKTDKPPEKTTAETVNESLQQQLEDLGIEYPFSSLRLGRKQQEHTMPSRESPFVLQSHLPKFLNRSISCFAQSEKLPEVLAVGYSEAPLELKKKHSSVAGSNGLIVLFNTSVEPMLPEFFLLSTSLVTSVIFDKFDAFRVVAGTESGRLAVWDLNQAKPTDIAILPTLQSSSVLAKHEHDSNLTFLHHTSPIILLHQPDSNAASPSVVSVSSEGIVNVWSLSLLAFPKVSSRQIVPPAESVIAKRKFFGAQTCHIFRNSVVSADPILAHLAPEYNFLDRTVIGCGDGGLYKLLNSRSNKHTIEDLLKANTGEEQLPVFNISELQLEDEPLLITSHGDWQLRLWRVPSLSCIYSIPTRTLITQICVRPLHSFQFATLSVLNPPDFATSIQFWDLRVRAYSPIVDVPLSDASIQITRISYDAEGKHIFAGSENGDVMIWSVDEDLLAHTLDYRQDRNIDTGVEAILRKELN